MILAPDSGQQQGKQFSVLHQVMFNDGAERQGWEKRESAYQNDGSNQKRYEKRPMRGEGAAGSGDSLLASQTPGGGE
jgi:hypothetical protein